MSGVTIKDIAKRLGLSTATVSRALRDSHEISIETKQRVTQLAAELSFVPNAYASSLRRRKSKTIAVVLPEVTDSFFSTAINGIEAIAIEKKYHVLIYLTHENFEREKAILTEFKSGRVDGILISVSEETNTGEHISDVMAAGIPLVFFDRKFEEIEAAKVVTDDFESGYKATRHLIEKDCKNIYYLCIAPHLSISMQRADGYKKALQEAGIAKEEIIICSNSFEENCNLVKQILNQEKRPDGIIVSVEKLTAPVYLACRECNISIPDDLKMISFTNMQTAQILNPPLTTITQPAFEMGKRAATILFNGIEKKHYSLNTEKVILPSVLTERQST